MKQFSVAIVFTSIKQKINSGIIITWLKLAPNQYYCRR